MFLDDAFDALHTLPPSHQGCETLPFDDDPFDIIHGQCGQESTEVPAKRARTGEED